MTPNPNPSPEGVCGVCKGTRRVTMAASTTQLGGESPCFNCDKDGIWFSTATTMTAFASGVAGSAALTPPTPAETVTVALPGAGEAWSLDLDRREIYLGNQMLFMVYSCDDFWHVEGVASKDRQWFDEQAKAAVLTLNTVATVAAANDEGVAKAGAALVEAWNSDGDGFSNTLPPIEFSEAELAHLVRAVLSSQGSQS